MDHIRATGGLGFKTQWGRESGPWGAKASGV